MRTWRKHSGVKLAVLAAMAAALPMGAQAQTAETTIQRQADDAYRMLLQQPQDTALWSQYARLQADAGNYEGAVAALERLLLLPDPPAGVELEIAVMYFRLRSYAEAGTRAQQALDRGKLTPEQQALARSLVTASSKRSEKSQLNGAFSFGLRTQTNPMYRSSESQTFAAGVLVPVPANQRPDSDWDANAGLRLTHLYDLDLQNSAAISTTFGAFIVDYHGSKGGVTAAPTRAYDLVHLEFTTGLDFKPMAADLPGLTLRPHIAASQLYAQRDGYLSTAGVGLDVGYRFSEFTVLDMTLDTHRRSFEQRIDLPNAGDVSGRLSGWRTRLVHEVAPGQVLTGEVTLRRNRTNRAFHDYDQQEGRVSYARTYGSPWAVLPGSWTSSVWLGVLRRSFDAADPAVNAATARKDNEWRLGVAQTVPLAPAWYATLSLEHARGGSSLPNFRFRNTTAAANLLRTF